MRLQRQKYEENLKTMTRIKFQNLISLLTENQHYLILTFEMSNIAMNVCLQKQQRKRNLIKSVKFRKS